MTSTFTLTGTLFHQDNVTPVAKSGIKVKADPYPDTTIKRYYTHGVTFSTNANGHFSQDLVTEPGLVYTIRSTARKPEFHPVRFNAPAAGVILDITALTAYIPGDPPLLLQIQALANAAASSATAAAGSATAASGSASAASAIVDPTGGYAHQIGNSNGSDDTAALNGILTTAGHYRGTPGQNYQISAPIVMRGGTTLDMTGCTVTLKAGSNCNMLNNRAVSTSQRTMTASITNGSTTLTGTGLTSADIGRSVVIPGAMAANGGTTGPLCVQITAVATGTSATVSAPATATVASVTATVYDRDTDITVRGGIWDRGANSGTGPGNHTIRFRRADRITVEKLRVTATGGKYAINFGSCNRFSVDAVSFNTASDGVHVNGDCQYGMISRLEGTTGDDFVALVAREAPTYTQYEDVAGDIRDILVSNLNIAGSLASLKILGGSGTIIQAVRGHNIVSEGAGTGGVSVGGEDATLYVGDLRDITIDGLSTNAISACAVISNVKDLTVRNVKHTSATANTFTVLVGNSTVDNLVVDGVDWRVTGASSGVVGLSGSTSTIGRVRISRAYAPAAGSSSYLLRAASGGSITAAYLNQSTFIGGGGLIQFPTGTLTNVTVSAVELSGTSWIADLGTATDILMSGVRAAPGAFNLRATASLILRGEGNVITAGSSLAITAGGIGTILTNDLPYSGATGGKPTAAVGAGAGTGGTASFSSGNDRSGTITVVSGGSGTAAGTLATISFTRTFGAAPRQVKLTPTSAAAAAVNPYITTKATTGFVIAAQTAPAISSTCSFDYEVIL